VVVKRAAAFQADQESPAALVEEDHPLAGPERLAVHRPSSRVTLIGPRLPQA
jgi:hypothetical protein